jgi:hypothetical protein
MPKGLACGEVPAVHMCVCVRGEGKRVGLAQSIVSKLYFIVCQL